MTFIIKHTKHRLCYRLENYHTAEDDTYIEEFGRRNDAIKELPDGASAYQDGILAYRLLRQASLSEADHKLIRATVQKLTYNYMIDALKKRLGEGAVNSFSLHEGRTISPDSSRSSGNTSGTSNTSGLVVVVCR